MPSRVKSLCHSVSTATKTKNVVNPTFKDEGASIALWGWLLAFAVDMGMNNTG